MLLVEAEPGAGKTSLLQAAVNAAGGMTVVRATGVESEAEIEFSGLLAVLRPLLGGLDALPATQSDALRGVLGLAPTSARDRFAIGAATLSLLAHAAEDHPLLVVVDDAQWIDGASVDALCFAGRRLVADSVALLAAARTGEAPAFSAAGFEALVVGELDAGAAAQLVESVGGRPVAPEVIDRLRELTGGNPLALVEIPAVLSEDQLAGSESVPDPLPVGPTIERTFLRRLEVLPAGTQDALAVLALAGDDDVESVTRALAALGASASDLEP